MLNTRLKRESYGISGCVEIFSWNGLQGQNNILLLMRLFHWTIQVSLKAERIQTSHFQITPNDWKKLSRGFFAAVLRLKEDWRSGQLSDFFVCSAAFLKQFSKEVQVGTKDEKVDFYLGYLVSKQTLDQWQVYFHTLRKLEFFLDIKNLSEKAEKVLKTVHFFQCYKYVHWIHT